MDLVERKIIDIIESKKNEIIKIGRHIWENAELGYEEYETSNLFASKMKELGLNTKEGIVVTGVKSYLKENSSGINICIMGELDGLPIDTHKNCNKKTGASHCCGHNAQIAGVIGCAMALSEIKDEFDGNVTFFAVPAEDYARPEIIDKLTNLNIIKYTGGKCELIRTGELDDIDLTIGHHIITQADLSVASGTTNGIINKTVKFTGVSAHSAGDPHKGVDAFSAYEVGVRALDAQRETFRDEDFVRVHGYVSNCGKTKNIIADLVEAEYSIRAKNISALIDASKKFDRSMKAGAIALGAGLEITSKSGYLPTIPCKNNDILQNVLQDASNNYKIDLEFGSKHFAGATDYGDISSIMPLLQFQTGGYQGNLHNDNVDVVDEYLAYVVTAKIFALTAYRLLKDNAKEARDIILKTPKILNKSSYKEIKQSMENNFKMDINQLPIVN